MSDKCWKDDSHSICNPFSVSTARFLSLCSEVPLHDRIFQTASPQFPCGACEVTDQSVGMYMPARVQVEGSRCPLPAYIQVYKVSTHPAKTYLSRYDSKQRVCIHSEYVPVSVPVTVLCTLHYTHYIYYIHYTRFGRQPIRRRSEDWARRSADGADGEFPSPLTGFISKGRSWHDGSNTHRHIGIR